MDTTGFSRVEIQLEPKWIAERWSQIPLASAAWYPKRVRDWLCWSWWTTRL